MFSNLVAQREGELEPEETSQPAEAQSAPDAPAPTAGQEETGQELQPVETPAEGADEAPEASEAENVLSQSEDAELAEALKGLDDSARKKLIDIAKSVKDGDETIGGVKRIHQLTNQIKNLESKLEELQNARPEAPAPNKGNLPDDVAGLKTLHEVEKQHTELKGYIRDLEKFLDRNPDGGVIGGQEFTRDQILERKWAIQDKLELLPQRAQAIQQAEQFAAQRKEVTAQIRQQFAFLEDPEHPETKAVRQLVRDPKFSDVPNAEYLALALLRGNQVLQQELAQKAGGHRPPLQGATKPAVKPVGKVPLGKPHTPASGTPARPIDGVSAKSALERVRKEGSRDSFAAFIAAKEQ